MRAFTAIELPEPVRRALAALQARLETRGARARWTAPAAMHLTLRFLGDVSEVQAGAITDDLLVRYAAEAPLQLTVAGVGCFPHARRPGVVWVGIEGDTERLARVQEDAEASARGVGLEGEARPFHPHVTLARVRDPGNAGALIEALSEEAGFAGGSFTAAHVTLFESTLLPAGPRYTVLAHLPLGAPPMSAYNKPMNSSQPPR
jgi:2'-5' RNA ligase